ncbi:MAG: N-acetylmuramic acid 6-phosphate etherase [Anaerolineae bacterium]|nr:N-acetylmuramic acid 6-phosphate etherase [Anaerolineae bacterium]
MIFETEKPNPRSTTIDQLPTLDMLRVINDEDARVAEAVGRVLSALAAAVDLIADRLRGGGRLFYIGAGTSGRLGVLDAVECVPTFSVSPEMVQGIVAGGTTALTTSVEGAEDDQDAGHAVIAKYQISAQDAVVGIAASGRTPYVIGALEAATAAGAATIAVSCNAPAPILDLAQISIAVVVGPEVIAGSTRLKAGTAQKMVLNMLSTGSMIRLGKVYGNLMVDVMVTNQKLAERARRLVMLIAGIDADTANRLLAQTDQQVKPAIVMALRGVSAAEARALLDAAQGMLRDVIGEHTVSDG